MRSSTRLLRAASLFCRRCSNIGDSGKFRWKRCECLRWLCIREILDSWLSQGIQVWSSKSRGDSVEKHFFGGGGRVVFAYQLFLEKSVFLTGKWQPWFLWSCNTTIFFQLFCFFSSIYCVYLNYSTCVASTNLINLTVIQLLSYAARCHMTPANQLQPWLQCRRCRKTATKFGQGYKLTMCDIVWMLPQSHISLSVRPSFFRRAAVAVFRPDMVQ